MNKYFSVVAVCVVALGASTVAMTFPEKKSSEPLSPAQERYCEGVEQWRKEEMLGVVPKFRLGRPDSEEKYEQWCTKR